jgi:hypothetical protein
MRNCSFILQAGGYRDRRALPPPEREGRDAREGRERIWRLRFAGLIWEAERLTRVLEEGLEVRVR